VEILLLALLLGAGALSGLFGSSGSDGGPEPEGPDDRIVEGTDGNNTIIGSARGSDLIFGNAGDDNLRGFSGNDTVLGGPGNDFIRGDDGNDHVAGGAGNDTLTGWFGADTLNGGAGNDDLRGGEGNDVLLGGGGSDTLNGDGGNDLLDGRETAPTIDRAAVATQLRAVHGASVTEAMIDRVVAELRSEGPAGKDVLRGGDGADTLIGDSGDSMTGGQGIDLFEIHYDAAQSWERVLIRDFDMDTETVRIYLPQGVAAPTAENPVEITRIRDTEGVLGSVVSYNDDPIVRFSGIDPANVNLDRIVWVPFGATPPAVVAPIAPAVLTGTEAANTLTGSAARDLILGLDGADTISGGAAADLAVGGRGNDVIGGDAGNDTLVGGDGADTLRGGAANDRLFGGAGNDVLQGEDGNDLLIGVSGANTLEGGVGDDTLVGIDYQNGLVIDASRELEIRQGLREVYGANATTAAQDAVIDGYRSFAAGSAPDVLRGGDGADMLIGDSGDTLIGGAGTDTYYVMYSTGPGALTWTAPVVVQDFNPAAERLTVATTSTLASGAVTYVASGADTIMRIGGVDVARFVDTTPAQFAPATGPAPVSVSEGVPTDLAQIINRLI